MNKDDIDLIKEQWKKELPDLSTDAMAIIGRLHRVEKYAEKRLAKHFQTFQINNGEFDVLATLRRSGAPYSLTPTELYQSLMITSGAMTNRIDTLEKKGYVKRLRNDQDRRIVTVTLTSDGFQLISKMVYSHVQTEEQLLCSLSHKEQKQFDLLLQKLLTSFETPSEESDETSF